METDLSPDNAAYIKRLVECGVFDSEAAALDEAVTVFREQAEAPESGPEPSERPAPSELGTRFRAIREQYISRGGKLLTAEEIDREVAERRGERQPQE